MLNALELDAAFEVVGGQEDDIGSLFLREKGAIALPMGVAPGCLSHNHCPIIVVVAAKEEDWEAVWERTLSHRQSDLVWIITVGTNNDRQLYSWQQPATVVLLPEEFQDATTHVYGKHAATLQTTLSRITQVSEVKSWTDLCQKVEQAAGTFESTSWSNSDKLVPMATIDLVCLGQEMQDKDTAPQSAIVVGGGIIGSSIARALAQRGIATTVYDPTPTGTTSPASWAWLNANQKPPHHYKSLNQMGLRGWRSDPILRSLPKWAGTLVRTNQPLQGTGGYTVEGPLSQERLLELEPQANFTTNTGDSYVYYFADEGHVDAQQAVRALRQEAKSNGVGFVADQRVIGLVRNDEQRVMGVKTVSSKDRSKTQQQLADVVIVAAGANSSDSALGGVPLVHNPSRTYFAKPSPAAPSLHRTLVDMVSSLYVAQRNDGTFVAGGGALKFGLSAATVSDKLSSQDEAQQMARAKEIAKQIAPDPVGFSTFTHKEQVVSKPMPKDGFPIVGYLEKGLYSVVTHSGMTLAPLIGQLVAAEVKEQVSLSILEGYRPARFTKENDGKATIKDWQESETTDKT